MDHLFFVDLFMLSQQERHFT